MSVGDMSVEAGTAQVGATDLGAVHFIGIGGGGMSGIARILLARGVVVSGSDAKESRVLAALRVLGATVHVGHDGSNVASADTVVVSTAIKESNPELVEARRRGLRVLPRAAALAAVMVGRRGVAVSGTHGKTTTTSMLTRALQHCGADPSFAIGADLNEPGSNAHDGTGDVFVAEADESDESFLLLSPYAAIVTNIEADHLNHFAGLEEIHVAFEKFARCVLPDGFLVVCADDLGARRLAEQARAGGHRRPDLRRVRRRRPAAGSIGAGRRRFGVPRDRPRAATWRGGAEGAWRAQRPERRRRTERGTGARTARSRSSPRAWPRSPGPGGGSSPRARCAACGSTTTTPITRRRSR